MYCFYLYLCLLSITNLPFLAAEPHVRAQAPAPTTGPLLRHRQINYICPVAETSCHDGLPGCCGYLEKCTISDSVPLCEGTCNGGPTCSGAFKGACCKLGLTCNYASTLCESDTMVYNPPHLTGLPPNGFSDTMAPSPAAPTPHASYPSPVAAPSYPTALSSSAAATVQGATKLDIGDPSSYAIPSLSPTSQSFPSVTVPSNTAPVTSILPTLTATVIAKAGQNKAAIGNGKIALGFFFGLSFGMMG